MTRPCPRRLLAILSTTLCTIGGGAGCASMRHAELALSPEFYGVWTTHGTGTPSWWEIRADRVVNYEASVDGQACEGRAINIVGADVLGLHNRIRLYLAGDQLVFAERAVRVAYDRAAPQDICRRPDGSYLDDAPYVVKRLKGRMA